MNKKIYDSSKYNLGKNSKVFSVFASDEYGDWTETCNGTSGYYTKKKNSLTSTYVVSGYGLSYYGSCSSKRTINNLKNAKEISFVYQSTLSANNVFYWSGGWDVYFSLLGGYVMLRFINPNSYIEVNGTALHLNLVRYETYNITLKQNSIIVDNVEHQFPEGTLLKNAQSNECIGYCYLGQISAGGGACNATAYLNVSDLNVKW